MYSQFPGQFHLKWYHRSAVPRPHPSLYHTHTYNLNSLHLFHSNPCMLFLFLLPLYQSTNSFVVNSPFIYASCISEYFIYIPTLHAIIQNNGHTTVTRRQLCENCILKAPKIAYFSDNFRRFFELFFCNYYLLYLLYIFSNAGIERFIISLSTQYDILTQPGQPKPSAATMSTSSSFAFSQNALLSSSSAFTNI